MELFTLVLGSLVFLETSALCVSNFSSKAKNLSRKARRRIFVDTSTLIDGRILSVARAGFIGDELLIPRSVVRELQLLADGSDSEKRMRARFGLDVVNELERIENVEASVFPDAPGRVSVDERLIELAKDNNGLIMTNDYNLSKVAKTEHIETVNINELAQGLRTEYLPGDKLKVRIVGAGSNPHQAVAYLSDGTMVVVDEAEKYIKAREVVEIEFVRYLQTNAGKMMFAKLAKTPQEQKKKRPQGRKKNPEKAPKQKDRKPKNNKKSTA
jgi:uncharacterized protein YacL